MDTSTLHRHTSTIGVHADRWERDSIFPRREARKWEREMGKQEQQARTREETQMPSTLTGQDYNCNCTITHGAAALPALLLLRGSPRRTHRSQTNTVPVGQPVKLEADNVSAGGGGHPWHPETRSNAATARWGANGSPRKCPGGCCRRTCCTWPPCTGIADICAASGRALRADETRRPCWQGMGVARRPTPRGRSP